MDANIPTNCIGLSFAPWNDVESEYFPVNFNLMEVIEREDTVECTEFQIENKELDEAFKLDARKYPITKMLQTLRDYLTEDLKAGIRKKNEVYIEEMIKQVNAIKLIETEWDY